MNLAILSHFASLDEKDQQDILIAVNSLCKDNPHAATQLAKLADLKTNSPLQWKMGLKFLKLPG